MATEQEIIDAKIQVNDNIELNKSLTDLATIFSGSGEVNFTIEREGVVVDIAKLKGSINSGNANEVQMIADLDAAMLTSIGADEVTATTIRKSIKDLVVLHDADIAAT